MCYSLALLLLLSKILCTVISTERITCVRPSDTHYDYPIQRSFVSPLVNDNGEKADAKL